MEGQESEAEEPGSRRFQRAHRALKREFRPMINLAGPVVLAELGWMAMGVVDTICVGRLEDSANAISSVALGHALFFGSTIIGLGLLLGLDTVISQAFGAGRIDQCRIWVRHGVYLALGLSPPLMILPWLLSTQIDNLGIAQEVQPGAIAYLRVVTVGLPSLLLYFATRRYLQAMDKVKAIVFALVSANLVNLAANWILIFGNLGAPALGVAGSAWATVISRSWMALVLVAEIVRQDLKEGPGVLWASWKPELRRFRSLIALGVPAAAQLLLEMGAFATGTVLIGRLDPTSLAAHQLALQIASVTFMVPLGVNSAAAVRVGQAIGRKDPNGAARSGWSAIALGGGFMAAAGLLLVLAPRLFLSTFTEDQGLLDLGAQLLYAAAIFQIFDGIQVVATGALRGLGDTRTPVIANFGAHWVIGLPVGALLCFQLRFGVIGVWVGFSFGLIIVALLLLVAWSRQVAAIGNQYRSASESAKIATETMLA